MFFLYRGFNSELLYFSHHKTLQGLPKFHFPCSFSLKVHHQDFFVDYSVEVHLRGALRLLTIYLFIFFYFNAIYLFLILITSATQRTFH